MENEMRKLRGISDKFERDLKNVEDFQERLYREAREEVQRHRDVIEATAAAGEARERAILHRINEVSAEVQKAEGETEKRFGRLVEDEDQARQRLRVKFKAKLGETAAAGEARARGILRRIDEVQNSERKTERTVATLRKSEMRGAMREKAILERLDGLTHELEAEKRRVNARLAAHCEDEGGERRMLSETLEKRCEDLSVRLEAEAATRGGEVARLGETTRKLQVQVETETRNGAATKREVRELSNRLKDIESDIELHQSSVIIYGCLFSGGDADRRSLATHLVGRLCQGKHIGDVSRVRLFPFESVLG
jgi:uncharacterized protein YggU (UPF0235/DUF167 family)